MRDRLTKAIRDRTGWVWLFLMVATGVSWSMGTQNPMEGAHELRLLSSLLIVIAFLKVRLVIRYFMEVRHANLTLRCLTDAWCIVVAVGILAIYLGLLPPLS